MQHLHLQTRQHRDMLLLLLHGLFVLQLSPSVAIKPPVVISKNFFKKYL